MKTKIVYLPGPTSISPRKEDEPSTSGSISSSSSPSPSSSDSSDRPYPESESPIRKVRSLREIYESCDVSFFACEPQTFEEAAKDEVWQKAMDEEIASIEKNKTWELVDLPEGKSVIRIKWVYKAK